ncbi:MAG: hypothetical protein M3Q81_03075 [bacterium]|nr:hypothetical protein [bacterium]
MPPTIQGYNPRLFLDLINIAVLMLIPGSWIHEGNWRFAFFILLAMGWFFTIDYIILLWKSLNRPSELKLFWVLFFISLGIIFTLAVGTVTFFREPNLQQKTGACLLSAKINEGREDFQIHITKKGPMENYDVSKEVFMEWLHPDQYLVESKEYLAYPCKQDIITVTHIPHFDFFIRAE